MRRCVLLLACAAAAAGSGNPEPVQVLQRVIAKIAENNRRIPNFTCVETVTREYYQPAAPVQRACDVVLERRKMPSLDMRLHPTSTDRLRLEVTMSSRGEIHAWSGASRFEDSRIDAIVQDGPMGTGAFGAFLSTIFEQDVKRFDFEGATTVAGQTRMQFSFNVPQSDSHYRMKVYNSWESVAYHGGFEVDTATGDVRWLEVQTGPLPAAAVTCQTTTRLDFDIVSLGNRPFLLPSATRQRFVASNAGEVENRISFSGCREYRGDSSITYADGPPPADGVPSRRVTPALAAIPSNLAFSMELLSPIDTATAAAGDPFTARLASALRLDSKIYAPKGALVEGRLLRVQVAYTPPVEAVVVLRPQAVETGGVKIPIAAVNDFYRASQQAQKLKKRYEILLPYEWETNSGLFRFPGSQVVVKKGFLSDWRTVPVASGR